MWRRSSWRSKNVSIEYVTCTRNLFADKTFERTSVLILTTGTGTVLNTNYFLRYIRSAVTYTIKSLYENVRWKRVFDCSTYRRLPINITVCDAIDSFIFHEVPN